MGTKGTKKARGTARKILEDRSGQAVTEYILLLAFIAATSLVLMKGILKSLDTGTVIFGAQLERDMKTGRMPSGDWTLK